MPYKGLDATIYMPLRQVAADRVHHLDRRHIKNGTPFPDDNPSSGMHHLLDEPIERSIAALRCLDRPLRPAAVPDHELSVAVDADIPLGLLRHAAKGFLTSGGQCPTCVRWQAHDV